MEALEAVHAWERRGAYIDAVGHRIFVVDTGGDGPPVVVLHGFPTCSFDWRDVIARIHGPRFVALDMLGYGLSDKPLDHRYELARQADVVTSVVEQLGIERCALVTHDMGDSVGGELCARALDGALPFEIASRVVTNGSIYMDLVRLSAGQLALLSLPDEPLPHDARLTEEAFTPGLAATFGSDTKPSRDELRAHWTLVARNDGDRILPRTIRYVEERRVHEPRWTGAIERHPSPLTIVWGDRDPIAVYPMAERLHRRVASSRLVRLDDIGHYPMIETPDRVAEAVRDAIELMGV